MKAARTFTILTGIALVAAGTAAIARGVMQPGDVGEHNDDAAVPYGSGVRIEQTIEIARPAAELYAFWRDLTNLPTVMSMLERVDVVDLRRSHWIARGPSNVTLSWDAEIIDDTLDRRIAWRSVGGPLRNAGSVSFTELADGAGTKLQVEIEWAPPGGSLGHTLARVLGDDPAAMVANDLRRFKVAMETAPFSSPNWG